jgi:hypothetical protein
MSSMRIKILVVIFLFLVGAFGYLGYEWIWHGNFLGNYQLQTDGSKPQNCPLDEIRTVVL